MRLIIEVFGRAWMFSLDSAKMTEPEPEKFEQAPVDPHSIAGGQAERAFQSAAEVQEFAGSGVRPPWFGFRGTAGS